MVSIVLVLSDSPLNTSLSTSISMLDHYAAQLNQRFKVVVNK